MKGMERKREGKRRENGSKCERGKTLVNAGR